MSQVRLLTDEMSEAIRSNPEEHSDIQGITVIVRNTDGAKKEAIEDATRVLSHVEGTWLIDYRRKIHPIERVKQMEEICDACGIRFSFIVGHYYRGGVLVARDNSRGFYFDMQSGSSVDVMRVIIKPSAS